MRIRNFQFPLSERTNCNTIRRASQREGQSLSVSSIGTNELQRYADLIVPLALGAFSFLYRNERTATEGRARVLESKKRFQFPLSERTNCNRIGGTARLGNWISFSFLYRNERTATGFVRIRDGATECLSVSSIGTNELQRFSIRTFGLNQTRFQFPLSERTNCNSKHCAGGVWIRRLSVSSIGTNELQPVTVKSGDAQITTFSFLYRNERTATTFPIRGPHERDLSVSSIGTNELQRDSLHKDDQNMLSFSFLYRNERTATISPNTFTFMLPFFQFPLSERTNCNHENNALRQDRPISFSFLYRNERTATRAIRRTRTARQYLSVSSIGTNELQLLVCFAHCDKFHLSVSSIGTNELQRVSRVNSLPTPSCFQFPLSERTNCNKRKTDDADADVISFSFLYRNERTATARADDAAAPPARFQFPLSERTNCNCKCSTEPINVCSNFQFPLSERTNCNFLLNQLSLRRRNLFQFPLSERTNCNAPLVSVTQTA